jgi:myo-inositol-1(or 4)-monophosphatase
MSPRVIDPLALRALAERAARRAGDYLRRRFGDAGPIDRKGVIDLVTAADREAEQLAIETVRAERPDDAFLAEERGQVGNGARVRWIIDPLDGTTNFARSFPMFAVSVAAEVDGALAAGAVHVPMLDELFAAAQGDGATLNGRAVRVSATARLDESFLATGFPYDIRTNPDNNLDHFARFAVRALAIRRPGAAAIDLAYVACGRFDGFWELRLKPWDLAAGALLITEAGGRITNLDGTPLKLGSPGVCASNGLVHPAMLAVLASGTGAAGGARPAPGAAAARDGLSGGA